MIIFFRRENFCVNFRFSVDFDKEKHEEENDDMKNWKFKEQNYTSQLPLPLFFSL